MSAYTRSGAPRSATKKFVHRYRKWLIVGTLVSASTGFFLLYEPVTSYLARRKGRHAISQAEQFIQQGELDQATLAVRVAATADPANPNIFRVAAAVLEESGDASAVAFRQQLLGMFPGNRADRIALIKSALRFNDPATARNALTGFTAADRSTLEILLLTASVATASNDQAGAATALAAAAKLDSSDADLRFRLAAAQIHSPDSAVRSAAQASLAKIAESDEPARWDARRELLRAAAAQKQLTEVRRLETEMMANPAATFDDRMLQLTVEQTLLHGDFSDVKAAESAATTPAQIGQLGTWLVVTHQSQAAQRWLENLPAETQEKPAVISARADVAADLRDWAKLSALLEAGGWGPISAETVRTAQTAREMSARTRTDLARELWNEDLIISSANLRGLMILDRLAGLWKMEPERLATLEAIVNVYPAQRWALADLLSAYYGERDTASLARIWASWEKSHPDDLYAHNDALMITLLREPGHPSAAVTDQAEKLLQSDPKNPYFLTTRALCYLRDRNPKAAVSLFTQLPEADRAVPARALYYGAALAATKQATLARVYLGKASTTLPEETLILQTAQTQVAKL